jgi:lysylphosphatidylglycerol synthetase-like protein (DUF2156 family)
MFRRRVFVAESSRIEGFIVCNPCLNARMYAIDIYRRRPDAPRGVIPFLFMRVMRKMQEEGIVTISLSLAPGLNCTRLEGDSWMLRRGIGLWWKGLNWLFDMRGTYHYKSRFRPHFRPMYIAARPGLTPYTLWSLLYLWKVFRPNP